MQGEKEIFQDHLHKTQYTYSGFSYGAIEAFESALSTHQRVDVLQLISPAFFQGSSQKYKRMQKLFFQKDTDAYCRNFLRNCSFPSSFDLQAYFIQDTAQKLHTLLDYTWEPKKLQKLLDKGTKIEVYLGEKDKIINAVEAKEFFLSFATVYYEKGVGHILKA